MRRAAHDRYEALAAAHALGEATPAERAEFAAHAQLCATCTDDAAGGGTLLARLTEARDEERWQPQLAGALEARLAGRRARGSQRTFATLGYAVVASLVLNVAFVGGFAGRALQALRVTPPAVQYSGTTRIVLERRPPRPLAAAHEAALPPAQSAKPALRIAARSRALPRVAKRVTDEPENVAAPDVFAGIALSGKSSERSVAFAEVCAEREAAAEAPPPGCPATPAFPPR